MRKGKYCLAAKDTGFKRFFGEGSQNGQAMTEYIFLIILVALVSIPIFKMLPEAVRGYVRPFYYCISRPLP